eukprot:gnl/MRDRNA2_/MRDRNA2_63352_c0_seq2.p2 gnl/MRDRNA2_/MRDRNA2_63352_c0~~gnl/MRDRNA2_/MRDRNA2_63352_c0_seq2.p2  ORF type:complete len:207 (-),score=37.50 gnl/MRDRNA2_/MRDRNA2_63352_c0_seq2:100-720(-)
MDATPYCKSSDDDDLSATFGGSTFGNEDEATNWDIGCIEFILTGPEVPGTATAEDCLVTCSVEAAGPVFCCCTSFCEMGDDAGGMIWTCGGGLLACLEVAGRGVLDLEDRKGVPGRTATGEVAETCLGEIAETCLVTLGCLRRCTGDEARREMQGDTDPTRAETGAALTPLTWRCTVHWEVAACERKVSSVLIALNTSPCDPNSTA